MSESAKRTAKNTMDPSAISALIAALADHDGRTRQKAYQSLVSMGKPAVAPLMEALRDQRQRVRWEAAKALSEMRAPAAAQALVNTLEDDSLGIRWLAADGLIAMKRKGLPPLLQTLVERPDSVLLREGAHHVLRTLAGEKNLHSQLAPVLAVLEDAEPALKMPLAARDAIIGFQSAGNE